MKRQAASSEVKQRRWKMIGHTIRKDHTNMMNIAMTWAPEERRKKGKAKTTWRRTVERERAGVG